MDIIDETKYTMIDMMAYCDFCGKKCIVRSEVEGGRIYNYFFCDCEDSEKYVCLKYDIQKISTDINKMERASKHINIRKMEAQLEIDNIKRKYGVQCE